MSSLKYIILSVLFVVSALTLRAERIDSVLISKKLKSIDANFFNVNKNIVKTIENQLFVEKKQTEEFLDRSTLVLPIVSKEIYSQKLPLALQYLPAAVSQFNNFNATERGAGIWNLPYIIGKKYGLQIDQNIDERRDISKSTDVAISYLQDLQKQYNNWYLSIFAFVSSPSELNNQINVSNNITFGSIYQSLNESQQKYYDQWVSAAYICNFYNDYQISQPKLSARTLTTAILAKNNISIKDLLNKLELKEYDFLSYNLSLKGNNIPKGFEFRIPSEKIEAFELIKDSLQKDTVKKSEPSIIASSVSAATPKPTSSVNSNKTIYHKVKSGDTVWGICKKYGITESKLKANNTIKGNNIQIGKTLKIVK